MSTRSRRFTSQGTDSKEAVINEIAKKRVENSWILFVKESVLNNSNFSIITLPHPAHGSPTKYCLDDINNKIYEVITFSEPYRSWFIDDTVKSDGSVLMATPINPLFLVLPRLREQCNNRAIPLEDLLSERGFDKIINFVSNLDAVADLKGPADIKAFKYNEEKMLVWLESKVRNLAKVLKGKNIHVTSGVVSATFISSNVDNVNIGEEFYLKYSYNMISEYLDDEIMELLGKRFDFKSELIEHVGNKRKSEIEGFKETNKKVKCEPNDEDVKFNCILASEMKKPKPLTTKEKARQKAASGSKTISSFFTKK